MAKIPSHIDPAARGKDILKSLGTSRSKLLGKRILDAGAGEHMGVAKHLGNGAEVHSIGLSYPRWQTLLRRNVQRMDYSDMKYPDSHFDEVLFSSSFVGGHGGNEFPEGMPYDAKKEHLGVEKRSLRKAHEGFLEALRVAKPGGVVRIYPMFDTGVELFRSELMPRLENQGCTVEIHKTGILPARKRVYPKGFNPDGTYRGMPEWDVTNAPCYRIVITKSK